MSKDQSSEVPRIIDPNPTARAHELRRDATPAEKLLWKRVRNHQLGFKFRRQTPIGSFIADLCCKERRLIFELDGDPHTVEVDRDAKRTGYLTRLGYRVIRFWNDEVLTNTEGAVQQILSALEDPHRRAE